MGSGAGYARVMTVESAKRVLARPVFGDLVCIEARDTLRLAADVETCREEWGRLRNAYADVTAVSKYELEEEMEMWVVYVGRAEVERVTGG